MFKTIAAMSFSEKIKDNKKAIGAVS